MEVLHDLVAVVTLLSVVLVSTVSMAEDNSQQCSNADGVGNKYFDALTENRLFEALINNDLYTLLYTLSKNEGSIRVVLKRENRFNSKNCSETIEKSLRIYEDVFELAKSNSARYVIAGSGSLFNSTTASSECIDKIESIEDLGKPFGSASLAKTAPLTQKLKFLVAKYRLYLVTAYRVVIEGKQKDSEFTFEPSGGVALARDATLGWEAEKLKNFFTFDIKSKARVAQVYVEEVDCEQYKPVNLFFL